MIQISGPPVLVDSPGFAGVTIRVPLSEAPSQSWMAALVAQELPGRGHRASGSALEFSLDRGTRDVVSAMRKIAGALEQANKEFAGREEESAAKEERAAERRASAKEKMTRQLEEWWASTQPAALPAGDGDATTETDGGEETKS